MDEHNLRAFLDRPLVAIVSTTRRDGAPHAVPVWYRYDGERITIWTAERRAWVRHLLRDPRLHVAIAEHAYPFSAILLSGHARVQVGAGHAMEEARHISRRYMPANEVEPYLQRWSELHAVVSLVPDRLLSWVEGS